MATPAQGKLKNIEDEVHLAKLMQYRLEQIQIYYSELNQLSDIMQTYASEMAIAVYEHCNHLEVVAPFRNNEPLGNQFKNTLTNWLKNLFKNTQSYTAHSLENFSAISEISPQSNLSVHLTNFLFYQLKNEISSLLESIMPENALKLSKVSNLIFDFYLSLINEQQLLKANFNDTHDESLKMMLVGSSFALECEKLKSNVSEWLFYVFKHLMSDDLSQLTQIVKISQSEFGLWVLFKADLLFVNHEALEYVRTQIEIIDLTVNTAIEYREATNQIDKNLYDIIDELHQHVKLVIWLLSVMVEHSIALENARDNVTHLIKPQHVDSILKREMEICVRNNLTFAIIVLDIDNFNLLKNQHAQEFGESTLKQVGELILNSVRASDFVFRHDQHSFLILLSNTQPSKVMDVTERIHSAVESSLFVLPNENQINLTISSGISMFEDDQDYLNVMYRAEQALLEAKHSGYNKIVFKRA